MLLIADPKRTFADRVSQALGGKNGIVHAERPGEIERLIQERPGEVEAVLLGPNFAAGDTLEALVRLEETARRVGTILVTKNPTPEILQAALRSGMRDVLEFPFVPDDLNAALARARDYSSQMRRAGVEVSDPSGVGHKVTTVFSTKGGCGKTVVASNLAIVLKERTGGSVALVDLDLQSGDLAMVLQLLPAWTLFDAAENLDRLDVDALRGYMTQHRSGVDLLAAPMDPAQGESVTPKVVQRVLAIAKEAYDHVIVDTPPLFTDEVLVALDESDDCVLVTSMDVPSIKNLKLALQTLDKLGLGRDRIQLVLNRADSNVGLRSDEVEKAIETAIDVSIPSTRDVPLSVNRGIPLALEGRRSPVVAAIDALADLVAVQTAVEGDDSKTKRGLFRRRG